MELDSICVVCRSLPEDGGHLYLRCKEAKKCWRACELEWTRQNLLICSSAKEMVTAILKLPTVTRMRTICLLWMWWTERNKANHGKTRLSVDSFVAHVGYTTLEWSQYHGPTHKDATPGQILSWKPPPPDFIKLNMDASFHANSGRGGWGVIARDSDGGVVFAATGALYNQGSALHAETEAFLQAIRIAEQYGMGHVIFETDCLALQQALSSASQDRGPLGILFREAKFLLGLGFIEYRILHYPRSCNKPAHVLASYDCRGYPNDHAVWESELPDDVMSAVIADSVGPS